MITRFEQIIGFLTLTGVGTGIILSHFVMASTTYFIEVNFGLSQYVFGFIFLVAALPIALRKISRQAYALCIIPYGLYWLGNIRYVATAGLASVVPWIVTVLLIVLYWFVLLDIIKSIGSIRGNKPNSTSAG